MSTDTAQQAERTLLGMMLSRATSPGSVSTLIRPEDFSMPAYRVIAAACYELGDGCDIITVTDQLNSRGKIDLCGGLHAISELTDGIPGSASREMVQHYADIVMEAALRRGLKAAGSKLGNVDHGADPEELAGRVIDYLSEMRTRRERKRTFDSAELVRAEENDLPRRISDRPDTITTGIDEVDWYLRPGLMRGDFWVLGARPRIGKSSFMAGVIDHNLRLGKRVLHIACEMGEVRNFWRLLSVHTGVPLTKIRNFGDMNAEAKARYTEGMVWFEGLKDKYILHYQPGITPEQMRQVVRDAKRKMGDVDLLCVDYFQLLGADRMSSNYRDERTNVVRGLVSLAGTEKVPMLLGAQLNREAESDDEKDKPALNELKDTGALEEAASGVLLLHRWNLYLPMSTVGEVIVAKQQDGPCGIAGVMWDREVPRWTNAA